MSSWVVGGWPQVWLTLGLAVLASIALFWVLRRAWMADEYRGERRRCRRKERPGRHQKDGRPEDPTRHLDVTALRSARARVPRADQ